MSGVGGGCARCELVCPLSKKLDASRKVYMDTIQAPSQAPKQLSAFKKALASLLVRAMFMYVLLTLSFSVIYFGYTLLIGDDFNLGREASGDSGGGGAFFDVFVRSVFASSFVSAGSMPRDMGDSSTFARVVVICNVTLASLLKIWTICAE